MVRSKDKVEAPEAIRVVAVRSPEAADTLLALFEAIAQEQGWHAGNHIRAYLEQSHHFAAFVGQELAAGMQLALPDEAGRFPFHRVWPDAMIDAPAHIVHVTLLAVRPGYRGFPRLFWPLCVELWRFCVAREIQSIVIEATLPMLARYRRIGFELDVIGEARVHWGEECVLGRASVQAVAGTMMMRAVRSPVYRALVSQAMRSAHSDCAPFHALP